MKKFQLWLEERLNESGDDVAKALSVVLQAVNSGQYTDKHYFDLMRVVKPNVDSGLVNPQVTALIGQAHSVWQQHWQDPIMFRRGMLPIIQQAIQVAQTPYSRPGRSILGDDED